MTRHLSRDAWRTLAFAALVSLPAWAAAEVPSAICPVVKTGPRIDGAAGDAAWAQSFVYNQFTDNLGKGRAEPGMSFRAVTDGAKLYLALHMDHPAPASLAALPVVRDDSALFGNDCVEVFLAPDAQRPEYFHFAFGPTGSYWDNSGALTQNDFNYSVEHAARIADNAWEVEAAIPLSELGLAGGVKAGHRMALNVCREFSGPGLPTRLHCWSATGPGFHRREAFGELLIGTYAASAEKRLRQLSDLLASVRKANVSPSAEVQQDLAFWAGRAEELKQRSGSLKSAEHWRAFTAGADEATVQLQRLGLGGRGLVVYEVNPWDLPTSEELPAPDVKEPEEIVITAMGGEYVTCALGVTNSTRDPLRVQCTSTDWMSPSGMRQLPARDHLTLREAVEVGLRGGGALRDALPGLDPGHHVSLPSGRNGVLWMTLNTHDMPAGVWVLGLKLMPLLRPQLRRTVRVVLRVLPVALPSGPRPYSSNWYAMSHQPSKWYPEAAAADLVAHYTNVVHTRLKFPEYDAAGNMTRDLDFSGIEEDFRRFGKQGNHFVLGHFYHWFPDSLGNKAEWTDKQQERFAYVIRKVRAFFEAGGLGVADFSWYARDEPTTVEFAKSVETFGKRLRLVDPEQQIFVTIYSKVTKEAIEMMLPYVNVWVPSQGLSDWQRQLTLSRRGEGVRYFSYSVLGKASSPYHAYRLSAWRALSWGYEGIGFWCYDDVGGPGMVNWDDTDGKQSDYAVIYEGADGPVTGVRWEAWRQGIQDYRLVEWARKLAADCHSEALATEARKAIDAAIPAVLSSKDCGSADRANADLRALGLRMLAQAGRPVGDADPAASLPYNLTGNGGPLSRHIDTHGSYTPNLYRDVEHYGEACEVMAGPIYFRGRDATEEPQSKNKADGNLTDDLIDYPNDYTLYEWPPAKLQITFDFKATYRFSHLLALFIDQLPEQSVSVYVGDSAKPDGQRLVATMLGTGQVRTPNNELYFDLQQAEGRYVRLEITTSGKVVRMGEVRVWGWPAGK